MRIIWNDSDTLTEIDGVLRQLKQGETYEVNPKTQPQFMQLVMLKERIGTVEFTDDISGLEDAPNTASKANKTQEPK